MFCNCARGIPQYILTFINSIFLFVGFILLVVGLTFTFASEHVVNIVHQYANNRENQVIELLVSVSNVLVVQEAGRVMLGLSGCLLPIPLCGYIGAVRINPILLVMYAVPLLLLWIFQLVALTCLPLIKGNLERFFTWVAYLSLQSFRIGEESNLVTVLWSYAMATFSCCGFSGYRDFKTVSNSQISLPKNQKIPESCCILDDTVYPIKILPMDNNCIQTPTKYNSFFMQGCAPVLSEAMMQNLDIIVLSVICILTIQIILVVLALCLCMLREKQNTITHTLLLKDENRPLDEPRSHKIDLNSC